MTAYPDNGMRMFLGDKCVLPLLHVTPAKAGGLEG